MNPEFHHREQCTVVPEHEADLGPANWVTPSSCRGNLVPHRAQVRWARGTGRAGASTRTCPGAVVRDCASCQRPFGLPFWLPASHYANWARYRHARRHCSHPWPRMRRDPSRRVAREMPTAHSSYITTAGRRISVRCLRVRAQVRHSLERTPMRFRIARIKGPQPCARRPARAQGQH
jgi:hypothetical protein